MTEAAAPDAPQQAPSVALSLRRTLFTLAVFCAVVSALINVYCVHRNLALLQENEVYDAEWQRHVAVQELAQRMLMDLHQMSASDRTIADRVAQYDRLIVSGNLNLPIRGVPPAE